MYSVSTTQSKGDSDGIGAIALRPAEAAAAIGVSRATIYSLLKTGAIRYRRLPGGDMRIPVSALHEWAEATQ